MKSYAVVFFSVLLAELGDKTQLATLVFATDPGIGKLGVFLASAGALLVASGLAVIVGDQVARWVPPRHLRVLAALGFIAIGTWMLLRRG
jgi:putative Ca2+/H+ antiporter (TMEM165/GDT1 family)